MKAAVGIDDYKLETFKAALKDAGFPFEVLPGVTSDTFLLSVEFEGVELEHLNKVLREANDKARRSKRN